MDLLSSLGGHGASLISYIVPFLFVLSVVVFFHELGHFIVGRLCGVRVLAFSVGFGPELFGFTDRHGTRWKISAIPLGGYVKFFGDSNAASVPDWEKVKMATAEERSVSFFHKSIPQRAAIIAAGPIANFVLAILIFSALFTIYGKDTVTPQVNRVTTGSAAEAAGLRVGDLIVTVNGKPITAFKELQSAILTSDGKPLALEVLRGADRLDLTATPTVVTQEDGKSRPVLGVIGTLEPEPLPRAVWLGVEQTGLVVTQTFDFLGQLIRGQGDAKDIGGPIKIAQMSKEVADNSGFGGLIMLTALLSISIGLLNLFPVPLLDGGHLLFYAVEAIRGRPLAEQTQEYAFRLGFALVLMLMMFTLWNDIANPFRG